MRPFLFKAQEVPAPAFTVSSATAGATGVAVTWVDPTPVPAPLSAYDPISNPTGFLGNPNNEIGFRVERSPGTVAVDAATFVPVATGLVTINPITHAMNAQANATTYTDTTAGGAPPAVPTAPTVASATDTTITLNMPARPAGVAGYVVYRDGVLVTPATVTTATWQDTGLTAGTSYSYTLAAVASSAATDYTYRVAAVTAAGDTLSTNVAAVTVTVANSAQGAPLAVATVPAAPTALVFTNVLDVSMTAGWTASTGATSYDVTVNAGAVANVTTTTDALAGLTGNTSYTVSVKARNASGASATALTGSQLTLPGSPLNPQVGAITSASVALSWAAPVGGATTYSVQYSSNGFATVASTPAAAGTATTVTGLAAATPYAFRVVANNATGSSTPSVVVNATTLSGLPLAPTNLVFSNVTATTLTASWTGSAGATSYDVTVNGVTSNIAATTDPLTGLSGNTSYAFSILARNAAGASATALAGTQLTLPNAPGTPVVGTRTSSSIALTWAVPAGGAASYTVQYSTNGFGTVAGSVASAGTATTVTGLAASTTYSFRVLAGNAAGSSLPSGTATGTTLAGAPAAPPAPTLGAVTNTNVTLSWAAIPGATSYTLYRNGIAVWTGTTTTRTQRGQAAGNTYSFTLAVTTAGGTSAQSAATVVTTPPSRPAAPTASTVGNTAQNHLVTVTVPALPATETAAITYTIRYQYRTAGGLPWGPVTVLQAGVPATAAAQAIAFNMPAAGRYRFSIVAVDAGGTSAASGNSAQVSSL